MEDLSQRFTHIPFNGRFLLFCVLRWIWSVSFGRNVLLAFLLVTIFKLSNPTTIHRCFFSFSSLQDASHVDVDWVALWVYEAERWNLPLWKNMILMGNNGRYLTALVFPFLLLLNRSMGDKPLSVSKPLMLALLLVLPLSMLAGMHGQTMWTDEAGESFSNEIKDGEDFLYIDDEALAMHWLYTFRLELDAENDRDITGHWRTPDSNWEVELEGVRRNIEVQIYRTLPIL